MNEPITEAEVAALEKGYGLYPANVNRLCAAWRELAKENERLTSDVADLDSQACQLTLYLSERDKKIEEQQAEIERLNKDVRGLRQFNGGGR